MRIRHFCYSQGLTQGNEYCQNRTVSHIDNIGRGMLVSLAIYHDFHSLPTVYLLYHVPESPDHDQNY